MRLPEAKKYVADKLHVGVGGHAPCGGVRVRQHAHVLEVGQVVADGGRGDAELEVFSEVPGAHGDAPRDVLLDDGPQDLLLPAVSGNLPP